MLHSYTATQLLYTQYGLGCSHCSLGCSAISRNLLLDLFDRLRARAPWYKAALTASFARHALPRFASGAYAPIVDRVFEEGLDGAAAAHAYMETNANIGKIVVQVVPDA